MKIITVTSEDYISIAEASEKYNYSQQHLNLLCRKQKIKAFKNANRWYLFEPSLKTYLLAY